MTDAYHRTMPARKRIAAALAILGDFAWPIPLLVGMRA
jgi:hypothetical protein